MTAADKPTVSDEAVEAAARSNYEFQNAGTVKRRPDLAPMTWETRAEWLKDAYRQEARAALAAARPHLVPRTKRD